MPTDFLYFHLISSSFLRFPPILDLTGTVELEVLLLLPEAEVALRGGVAAVLLLPDQRGGEGLHLAHPGGMGLRLLRS